jgi:hypothetical protein
MTDLDLLQQLVSTRPGAGSSFEAAVFALVAAFLLGQAIAALYVWTYRGIATPDRTSTRSRSARWWRA